jgi:hypothetical protein
LCALVGQSKELLIWFCTPHHKLLELKEGVRAVGLATVFGLYLLMSFVLNLLSLGAVIYGIYHAVYLQVHEEINMYQI